MNHLNLLYHVIFNTVALSGIYVVYNSRKQKIETYPNFVLGDDNFDIQGILLKLGTCILWSWEREESIVIRTYKTQQGNTNVNIFSFFTSVHN